MAGGDGKSILAFALLFIALFTFYVLWVSPDERRDLFGDLDNKPSGTTPDETATHSLLSTTIGSIGVATGTTPQDSTAEFNEIISYPKNSTILSSASQYVLESTVFSSKNYEVTATSVPADADSFLVKFKLVSYSGSPLVKVTAGSKTFYSSSPSAGSEYEVSVPASEVASGDKIRVSCAFEGLNIFAKNICTVENVVIERLSYLKQRDSLFKDFAMTSWDGNSATMKIFFKVNKSEPFGTLTMRINSVKVYEDKPESRDSYYVAETSTENTGLTKDANQLEVRTEKGGVYYLEGLKVAVYPVLTSEVNKTLFFVVPSDTYSRASKFYIIFDMQSIQKSGRLEFTFHDAGYTKYFNPEEISAGQMILEVPKDYLHSGTNKLTIFSTTGRFKIGDFSITWE